MKQWQDAAFEAFLGIPDPRPPHLDGPSQHAEVPCPPMTISIVLTENLIVLMIVEVVDLGLLASSDRVRPDINDAEFPSCRASRPSGNASRDHRVATSTDRAPTKSKVSATGAHSD